MTQRVRHADMASAPLLLIDFDHTLYNSRRYLRALFKLMTPDGATSASFWKAFEEHTSEGGESPFRPHAFFKSYYPDSYDRPMLDRFLTNRSGDYLYRDTTRFLTRSRKLGVRMELVTFADRSSRMAQLESSGISDLFDDINIFSAGVNDKIEYVRSHAARKPCILLDDHPQILASAEKSGAHCIRLQRRIYTKYINREPALRLTPVARTLSQAYLHVERHVTKAR